MLNSKQRYNKFNGTYIKVIIVNNEQEFSEESVVRVGIIGSGFIANHHLFGYSQLSNVEILGVSSLKIEEASKLMEKYDIAGKPIEDYRKLLEKDLGIVSLCIPNFLHEK